MNGHFVDVPSTALNAPSTIVRILPGAVEDSVGHMKSNSDTSRRVEQVIRLVDGFDPFGLELLASVHWLMKQEGLRTLDEITHSLYAWAPSKRQFSGSQIDLAMERLAS